MELILNHELDPRFKETSFNKLCDQTDKLNDIEPIYEQEQIEFAARNKLKFEYDAEGMEQNKKQQTK